MEATLEQLAERTGESVASLEHWRAAGLLRDADSFGPEDAECVRLVRFLLQRGFSIATIVEAERQRPGLLADWVSLMFGSGQFPVYTLDEAAAKSGLDPGVVRRVWDAADVSGQGDAFSEEDLAMLRGLAIALDAGLSDTALIDIVRVYADTMRRVAEAEVRLVHFHVHERLRAAGLPTAEVQSVTRAASERLQGLVEPAVLYFHRKGWVSAVRDDLALHVAEAAGADVSPVPGTLSVAVLFADLARFTPLTEAMGDAVAAEVVDRFSQLVRTAAGTWHGRVVKHIGDAYMLVFFEPRAAAACALEIEERASAESQFPAVRLGAHWGPVLYREGDYVGATVNLASRLEAEAAPHQLLVSAELRRAADGLANAEFVPIGNRTLKGVTGEVAIYELRRSGGAPREKLVDPVCGMELIPTEVAAWLDVTGETQVFCSSACLQRFVASPAHYPH